MPEKKCSKCDVVKPFDDFQNNKSSPDGKRSVCSVCTREQVRKHYWKNPEKHLQRVKDYRIANRDVVLEKAKVYARKNRVRIREQEMVKKYGISMSDYDRMLEDQGGVCAICEQPETTISYGKVQKLAIDHCHDTGKVRGLLCNCCNTGIGKFGDKPNLMTRAAEYLQQSIDR